MSEIQALVIRLKTALDSSDIELVKTLLDEFRERDLSTEGQLRGVDFSGAHLVGLDLSNLDLSEANLVDADLHGSNLSRSYLQDANLKRANLTNSLLNLSQFNGAKLQGTILARAELVNANLIYAKLIDADLSNANMQSARLDHADLTSANLKMANIDGASVLGANMIGATIEISQLVRLGSLKDTIMPDGKRYDGRYRLKGDLQREMSIGFNILNPQVMATRYRVTLEEYEEGQRWAESFLKDFQQNR